MANADHRHGVSHIHPWSPFLMSTENISSHLNSSLHGMNYLAPDITSQTRWAPDILAFSSFLAPISLLPTNILQVRVPCMCIRVSAPEWFESGHFPTQQFPSFVHQSHMPNFTKVGICLSNYACLSSSICRYRDCPMVVTRRESTSSSWHIWS